MNARRVPLAEPQSGCSRAVNTVSTAPSRGKPSFSRFFLVDPSSSLAPVGDVEDLHANVGGEPGELHRARDGQRGHRVDVGGPGLGLERRALHHHPGLIAGVVDEGLVDVEDHGRRQRLIGAGLLLGRRRPVRVGQRLLEADARQREDGQRVRLVLDRALHPQHRVEQVVRGRVLGACRRGRGQRGSHDQRGRPAGPDTRAGAGRGDHAMVLPGRPVIGPRGHARTAKRARGPRSG